jgi:hypothetical protein
LLFAKHLEQVFRECAGKSTRAAHSRHGRASIADCSIYRATEPTFAAAMLHAHGDRRWRTKHLVGAGEQAP